MERGREKNKRKFGGRKEKSIDGERKRWGRVAGQAQPAKKVAIAVAIIAKYVLTSTIVCGNIGGMSRLVLSASCTCIVLRVMYHEVHQYCP